MSRQLTESDRAVLAELLDLNVPKTEIARRLHKHRATIYRELARNTGPVGYVFKEAQQRTDVRRWMNHPTRKMRDPQVCNNMCASGYGDIGRPTKSLAGRGANSAARRGARFLGRQS